MGRVILLPDEVQSETTTGHWWRRLARYVDPLTLPQTKTECISHTKPPWPGGPIFAMAGQPTNAGST